MLFLNLLNRIFGSMNGLQRKDIDRYQEKGISNEEKQAIEEKGLASNFDADALEGFESQQLNSSAMSNLDNRFAKQTKSNKNGKVIILIVSLAASFALLFWVLDLDKGSRIEVAQQKAEQITKTTDEDESKNQELEILEKIDQEEDLKLDSEEEKSVVNENAIREESPVKGLEILSEEDDYSPTRSNTPDLVSTDALAPKEIFTPNTRNFTFQQQHELFMSDYKVVDYRGLREEKKIDYISELRDDYFNQMEMLDNNITENIEVTKEIYYIDYLEYAMYSLKQQNWGLAKNQFKEILSTYPNDVNANFYLGYLYFRKGEFEKSLDFFKKSYSYIIGNFREEALWHIAQANLAMKNTKEAKDLLQKIIKEDGFYADDAKQLLKELK